jgi:sec-independent protein translocase protein TatC
MGGAFMGLVTSKGLIKNWRWGFMVALLGGLLTPGNDPMSWALMSGPMLLLYFGSIVLVKMVENSRAKQKPA